MPVTPGDDFYRFRRHVGQAADHFDTRFVPAKINQRKATAHRLYEIAQELDPGDRDKVGNVSLKERSDSGYLWRRLHAFRAMPFGTPDTRRRCGGGSGTAWTSCSTPTATAAPASSTLRSRTRSEEWKGYLDKQIRFHSAADGDNHVIPDTSWLTPEVVTNDIANYGAAGEFFRRGMADDDFLDEPRSTHRFPSRPGRRPSRTSAARTASGAPR